MRLRWLPVLVWMTAVVSAGGVSDGTGGSFGKILKGTAVENAEGKLEVTLTNTGSVHQMLNDLSVELAGSNGASYSLSEEELQPLSDQNLLTNSQLRTVIEIPEALQGCDSIAASIDYDYEYSA